MNTTGRGSFSKKHIPWNKGKQFCPKNHDTFECGRTKGGNCIKCQQERAKEKIKTPKIKSPLCSRGHNKDIVGRLKDGSCRECRRENDRKNYIPHPRKQTPFCLRGHDTSICGRNSNGVCKDCLKLYHLKRKSEGKVSDYYLKKLYGISLVDFNKMLEKQNGLCLGCNRSHVAFDRGLCVDHDHKTGKVRGLLCGDCNTIIGMAKDNIDILKSLITYLIKYR